MRKKDEKIPRLLEGMRDRVMHRQQPLILVALVAGLVIDSVAAKIELANEDLNDLEEDGGLHGYDNRRRGNLLEMDFMKAIQILHFLNRTLGLDAVRLQFIFPSLMRIIKETKKITAQEQD